MQLTTTLFVALATTATAQRVVPVHIKRDHSAKVPSLNSRMHRRAAPFDEVLANNVTTGAYFATVEVGSPGQSITVHVDTGSSDVWVLAKDSDLCVSTRKQTEYGYCLDTFDRSASSSYSVVDSGGFEIEYLDGSGASGDYFTDNINVGTLNVKGVQMGLARKSTSSWGMLGIGYGSNVASSTPYLSIIDQMLKQGLIGIKAYSLYLNDLEASTGTILFGGIDTEKYIDTLKTVPILPDPRTGNITHFSVALSSLSSVKGDGSKTEFLTEQLEVILDSGTTLTYLPKTTARKIYTALNAYDDSARYPLVYVDCALRTADPAQVLRYQFGANGPIIEVSLADIIFDDIKPFIQSGDLVLPKTLGFSPDNACSLGLQPSSEGDVHLLGDSFLRSAYVVYDLTHNTVSMAQSNMNSTKENIIEIAASATGIPSATGAGAPPKATSSSANSAVGLARSGSGWEAAVMAGAAGLFTVAGGVWFVL
ncbi:aspartic-type endopeptidase [Lasiosphaeria hispida]|uniref:Aspartic-type endopeptidase n=1 Tax=Lasiosphaeria hispida TaxID=260671 RepID=A0AAJ0HAD4_9PEZI|nr:aspartic-type endopeptidase [Lasiosphaeria hispida]